MHFWSWMLLLGIGIAGPLLSRMIPSEHYKFISIVAAVIVAICYTYASYVIRWHKKNGKVQSADNKFPYNSRVMHIVMLAPLFYVLSYLGISYGLPLALDHFTKIRVEENATITGTPRRNSSLPGSIRVDRFSTISRAFEVDDDLFYSLKVGDQVKLTGRKSWFGYYVDKIEKINKKESQ